MKMPLLDEKFPETKIETISDRVLGHSRADPLLTIPIRDWAGDELLDIRRKKAWFPAALTLFPTAYGCVHFETLSFVFPTPAEKLLWKVSCIFLVAAGSAAGFICMSQFCALNLPGHKKGLLKLSRLIIKTVEET